MPRGVRFAIDKPRTLGELELVAVFKLGKTDAENVGIGRPNSEEGGGVGLRHLFGRAPLTLGNTTSAAGGATTRRGRFVNIDFVEAVEVGGIVLTTLISLIIFVLVMVALLSLLLLRS